MTVCETCGTEHLTATGGPACKAHGRRSKQPCRNAPIRGGTVCRMHGGSAPQARAAADTRIETARIEGRIGQLLSEADLEVGDLHPIDALLAAARRATVTEHTLARLVAELDTALGHNRFGEQVVHPLVVEHRRWAHLAATANKLALEAGIDERRLALDTADIDRLHSAVLAAVAAAGLTDAQTALFTSTLAAQLRELDPGE